ncbi:MAG: SMI1/KNR4 family protein [Proteobacteria bacterium]|nr:SMI1/KNR4 family protein [Pseudomonadota bacterium]
MNAKEFHRLVWEILEPVDSSVFEVVRAQAASENDIAAVEAATGLRLPEYFAGFVGQQGNCNGLAVFAREEVWPAPKEFSVGPAWTFWRGVTLLGIDVPDLPDFASISSVHKRLVAAGVRDVLPLIKVWGDGDRFWGTHSSGAVVLVQDGEVMALDGDLKDVYAEQINDLIQRQKDMAEQLSKA